MEGDGMIAVVRGLRDSSLCVTLLDRNGQYTFMPNSASKTSQPNTIYGNKQKNTVSQTQGGEVHHKYDPKCDSSAQVIDGRYASVYKTTHCNMIPTSPQIGTTEFPPQRPELCRGHGNFEVGGLGSGEISFSPSRASSYKGGLSWPDRGSVFTARPTVEPCSFAKSLRKYPHMSMSPERSCEVFERLINYSHMRNAQKQQKHQLSQLRSDSSTRSKKNEGDIRTDESPTRERSRKCDIARRFDRNYDVRYLTTRRVKNPQDTYNDQVCPIIKENSSYLTEQKLNQNYLNTSKSVNMETQAEIPITSRGVATIPPNAASVKNVAIPSSPMLSISDQSLAKASKSLQTIKLDFSLHIRKSVQTSFSSIDINGKNHKEIGHRKSKSHEHLRVNDLEDEIVTLVQDIVMTDERESIRDEVLKKLKKIYNSDRTDKFKITFGECIKDQLFTDIDYSDLSDDITSKIHKYNVFDQQINVLRADVIQPHRDNNYNKKHHVDDIIKDWIKNIPVKNKDYLGKTVNKEHLLHSVATKIIAIVNNKLKLESEKNLRNEIFDAIKDIPIAISNNNKRYYLNKLVTELLSRLKDLLTPVSTSKRVLKSNNYDDKFFDMYDTALNKTCPSNKEDEVRTFVREELLEFIEKFNLKICTESLLELELELTEIILDSFDFIRNGKDDRVKHEVLGVVFDLLNISEQLGLYFATNFVLNLKEKYKKMPQLKTQSFVIFNDENKNNNNKDSMKRKHDNDIQSSLDVYMDQVVLKIIEWILEVTDLNPSDNETETAINDLAGDIVDRVKYLDINPSNKGIENEIEHLKYQIFKSMSILVGKNDLNIIERAPELMQKIKSISLPIITKTTIDCEKMLPTCNESITVKNQNTCSNQIAGSLHVVGYSGIESSNQISNVSDCVCNEKIFCKQNPCCDTRPSCSHEMRPDFGGCGCQILTEDTDESMPLKKVCKCSQDQESDHTVIKTDCTCHAPETVSCTGKITGKRKVTDTSKKSYAKKVCCDKLRSNKRPCSYTIATDQKYSDRFSTNQINGEYTLDCCDHNMKSDCVLTDTLPRNMMQCSMGVDITVPESPMPCNMNASRTKSRGVVPEIKATRSTMPSFMGYNTTVTGDSISCNVNENRTLHSMTTGATVPGNTIPGVIGLGNTIPCSKGASISVPNGLMPCDLCRKKTLGISVQHGVPYSSQVDSIPAGTEADSPLSYPMGADSTIPGSMMPSSTPTYNLPAGATIPVSVLPSTAIRSSPEAGSAMPCHIDAGSNIPHSAVPGGTVHSSPVKGTIPRSTVAGNVPPGSSMKRSAIGGNIPFSMGTGGLAPGCTMCGSPTADNTFPHSMVQGNMTPGNPIPNNISTGGLDPVNMQGSSEVGSTMPFSIAKHGIIPDTTNPEGAIYYNSTEGGASMIPGSVAPGSPIPHHMDASSLAPGSTFIDTASLGHLTPLGTAPCSSSAGAKFPSSMVSGTTIPRISMAVNTMAFNNCTGPGKAPGSSTAGSFSTQARRYSIPTPGDRSDSLQNFSGNKRHSSPGAFGATYKSPSDCRDTCCNLPFPNANLGTPSMTETRRSILQSQSRRLSDGASSAPKRVSLNVQATVSNISDETAQTLQEFNEDFDEFLKDWVQKVPITENPDIAEKARLGLYNGIWIEIAKLKLNPEAVNNPFYYKEALDSEITDLLDCLPQTEELGRVRSNLKKELIEKAADVNQFILIATLPSSYKQQLMDNVKNNIPKDSNDANDIIQDDLINKIAENFIIYTNYKDTDSTKANVYKNNLLREVYELASNINQSQNVEIKSTTDGVIHALERVPIPNDEAVNIEADEILLGHEVEQWFLDLSLEPTEDLNEIIARRKQQKMLAKKLHEIENSNNNEQQIKEEIKKFLAKVPVRPSESENIDFIVDELQNRLKNRAKVGIGRRTSLGFQDYEEFSKNLPLCSSFQDDQGTGQSSSYMIIDGERLDQPYVCCQPPQNSIPNSQMKWLSLEETRAPSEMRGIQVNLPTPYCMSKPPMDHTSASCQTCIPKPPDPRPQVQSTCCQTRARRPPDPRQSSCCQTLQSGGPDSQQQWLSLEETRAPLQMRGFQDNLTPCCITRQTLTSTSCQTPIPSSSESGPKGTCCTSPGCQSNQVSESPNYLGHTQTEAKSVSCCMNQTPRPQQTLTRTPGIGPTNPCQLPSQTSMQSSTNIPLPDSTQTRPSCCIGHQTPGIPISESCQTMQQPQYHEESVGNECPESCCPSTSTENKSDRIRTESQCRSTSPIPLVVERRPRRSSTSTGRNERSNRSCKARKEKTSYRSNGRDEQTLESSPIEDDITPCFKPYINACGRPKKQRKAPFRKRLDLEDSDSDKESGRLPYAFLLN